MEYGDLNNPNPSEAERKANAEEDLGWAVDRLRQVLTERPDGMIPYDQVALKAIELVETHCLGWKAAFGLAAGSQSEARWGVRARNGEIEQCADESHARDSQQRHGGDLVIVQTGVATVR